MAHFESIRRPADAYPTNHFTEPTNMLIDFERETQHKAEGGRRKALISRLPTEGFSLTGTNTEQGKEKRA
jgi:hypothetical protein